MLSKKYFLTFFIGLVFFTFSFLTLRDYGISWDEPTHFKRGQGYLWYLITGDNDYHKLPKYDLKRAQSDTQYHERSIYQDDKYDAAFYRTIDGSHPPLADIGSSLTNMIFYQKLGWLGDVESYHLFEIFVASLGVAALFLFVYESFGFTAAVFSTVLFATYPLFWAESHFNIKDPVETSWIILTFYFLWKGIKDKAVLHIFLSSVFAGFALGTKFNIVFLSFIILPWFFAVFRKQKNELTSFAKSKKFIFSIVLYPVIMFFIFYASYPFLWDNPIVNIGKVLTYYGRNALDPAFSNAILPSWPFYAIRWVILTAPPLVLLGFVFSLIAARKILLKESGFLLLVLLWLLVTIVRVSIPGVNIYGGVRQIMEYIPAISILAGVGLAQLLKNKRKEIVIAIFLITVSVSIFRLIQLHPNENVYFNFLLGGLKGAVESGFPAAGNSFGNAYSQGVKWINENTLSGEKLTILQGSTVNITGYKLRSDIDLSGDYFSGINREGEYLIALTFNYEHKENYYEWEYVEKFLDPVYEVKVDGASILKIWENDLEHTKQEYKFKEKDLGNDVRVSTNKNEIVLEMEAEFILSRMSVGYSLSDGCSLPNEATVHISSDGKNWLREGDPLSFSQIGKRVSSFKPAWDNSSTESALSGNSVTFYFAAKPARFIRLVLDDEKSCILNNPNLKIFILVPEKR